MNQRKAYLSFLSFLSMAVIGCSSGPKLQGLAKNELGKNQYFDRLNEFSNFGSHEDYFFLLGYNFEDATELLMSTNHFDFGDVPVRFLKSRRFTVLNPFPREVTGFQPRIEGSPLFAIKKSTCGATLKGHQVCTLTITFAPKASQSKEKLQGRHQATLRVDYTGGQTLTKPLSATAVL